MLHRASVALTAIAQPAATVALAAAALAVALALATAVAVALAATAVRLAAAGDAVQCLVHGRATPWFVWSVDLRGGETIQPPLRNSVQW